MSRPSFRPRPIDLVKPLPIIKSSKDLRNEDDVVVNRALPVIATGVDPAEEEERHLKQALLASVYGHTTKSAVDIPIPVTRSVEPPRMPMRDGPFKRPPDSYIVFDRSDDDLEHATIDYDADFEDGAFVKKFNRDHPLPEKSKLSPLSLGVLERALDALEKVQGRQEGTDPPLIAYSGARAALSDAMPPFSDLCRRQVFAHWAARRARHPTPFLRFYQKQPDPADANPAVAFRPRDKDAATAGRRMNTYENFRRATTLREELETLRKILRSVVTRERIKLELSSVAVLQARLTLASRGGARLDAPARRALHTSRDRVVLIGEAPHWTALPARDLFLPHTYSLSELPPALGLAGERGPKKGARRSAGSRSAAAAAAAAAEKRADGAGGGRAGGSGRAALGPPGGVDTFGFDEHGNRFLKHMRYFAGGFMNYGVGPYDHRVFAAASERNTVRDLPRAPAPVTLPGPAAPFAALPGAAAARAAAARAALRRPRAAAAAPASGKTGFRGARDPAAAAALARAVPKPAAPRPTLKRTRRGMRVRGRVGRGGRIIFDRVAHERERGVKAASYPSSVEMGGVYTAGLPLEAAARVLRVARRGALGDVALLRPRALLPGAPAPASAGGEGGAPPGKPEAGADGGSGGAGGGAHQDDLFAKLVAPLEPVTHISKGYVKPNGDVDYWPHRTAAAAERRYPLRVRAPAGVHKIRAKDEWARLRALPAYKPIADSLVSEVEPEVIAMT